MIRHLILCALLAAPTRAETVLRYAPSADLSMLDPQITTATTVGQHGFMVYSMFIGVSVATVGPAMSQPVGTSQLSDEVVRLSGVIAPTSTIYSNLYFRIGPAVASAPDDVGGLKHSRHDPGQGKRAATHPSFEQRFGQLCRKHYSFPYWSKASFSGTLAKAT